MEYRKFSDELDNQQSYMSNLAFIHLLNFATVTTARKQLPGLKTIH